MKKKLQKIIEKLQKNKIISTVLTINNIIKKYNIDEYSAIISFWLISSIFPLLIVIVFSLSFLPFDFHKMIAAFSFDFLKTNGQNDLFNFLNFSTNYSYLSWNIIFILLSASKIINAILLSLSKIFHNHQKQNLLQKIKGVLFILLFIIIIVAIILFNISITFLLNIINKNLGIDLTLVSNIVKYIAFPLSTIFFLTILYYSGTLKNLSKKIRFKASFYGALFFAITWTIFINLFSLYIKYFNNMDKLYGAISTLLIFLLFLYFSSYLILLGALVTKYYLDYARIKNIKLLENYNKGKLEK